MLAQRPIWQDKLVFQLKSHLEVVIPIVFNRRTWRFYLDTRHQESNNQFHLRHACLLYRNALIIRSKSLLCLSLSFHHEEFQGWIEFKNILFMKRSLIKRNNNGTGEETLLENKPCSQPLAKKKRWSSSSRLEANKTADWQIQKPKNEWPFELIFWFYYV